MQCATEHYKFFFEEDVVGCFADQIPSSPGQFRYSPLNGPGYLHLINALASSGPQRCYCVIEGRRHYFIVLNTAGDQFLLIHAHGLHGA